jgi:hypothetical protein
MEEILKVLEGKLALPKVDEKGYSECPFAEELYAYKEQAERVVVRESKKLQPYLELVKQERERCRKNLNRLRVDMNSLNLDEAKKKYEIAKHSLKRKYNKAVYQRTLLIDLIKRTDELLKVSRAKKWPLGKPQREESFDPGAVLDAAIEGRFSAGYDPARVPPQGSKPLFNRQVNDLVSLAFARKRK